MTFDTSGLPSRSFLGFAPIVSSDDDGCPAFFVDDSPHPVPARERGCFDEAAAAWQRQGCQDGATEPSDAASLSASSRVDRFVLWFGFPSTKRTPRISRTVEASDRPLRLFDHARLSGEPQKMRMGIEHG